MKPPVEENAIIIISTCMRPGGVSYLNDCLRSMIDDGGLLDLPASRIQHCFAMNDGPLPDGSPKVFIENYPSGDRRFMCHFREASENLGDRTNFWRALRYALNFTWDRILYFEDDIRFVGKRALLRMLTCPILPDEGLVTFHDMKELSHESPYGLYHHPIIGRDGRGLWGLQAAVFPREVVEYLAALDFMGTRADNPRRQCDRVVEDFLKASRWPFMGIHCPSLVRHVGEVSAATPGKPLTPYRQSKREAPADFDAGLLVGATETRFY